MSTTSNPVNSTTYQALVNNAAAINNVPASLLISIQQAENPNLNVNAQSPTGVQGLAQITQATWNQWNPGVPYSTDPAAQISTQAKIVSAYNTRYEGNTALIAAAYNGGEGVGDYAASLLHQNPNLSVNTAISLATQHYYPGNTAKLNEINSYVPKVVGANASQTQTVSNATNTSISGTTSDTHFTSVNDVLTPAAVSQVPVKGLALSQNQLKADLAQIFPNLVTNEGITGVKPWYKDPNIVLPPVRTPNRFPVFFLIYFTPNQQPGTQLPITITFVASIKSFKRSMRHNISRKTTRTGFEINSWGMYPDTIDGQASTGIFMNSYGLNSYISLAQNTNANYNTLRIPEDERAVGTTFDGNLRIAARDAFVEFLSMFKNNGTVWFNNQNYTGLPSDLNQTAVDVWSPVTGNTLLQQNSSRNDVMTRGTVQMLFRNSIYNGYFKSMSWTMTADKPFSWDFSFSYVIEKTLTSVGLPTSINTQKVSRS